MSGLKVYPIQCELDPDQAAAGCQAKLETV